MRYLGLQTGSFHNLSTALVDELLDDTPDILSTRPKLARRGAARPSLELRNAVEAGSNLAVFQVTAELPLQMDLIFTGSLPGQPKVRRPVEHPSLLQRPFSGSCILL